MVIPRPEHERLFRQALDFNGIDERCTVLLIVAAACPPERIEVAYLPPPDPSHLGAKVLEHVGLDRLQQYRNQHRIDDGPLGGYAAMLVHEARHAVQFEALGPDFDESDQLLRETLLMLEWPIAYERLPSEIDANRTAANFVLERYPEERAALAADRRYRRYTIDHEEFPDLIEPTLALLWDYCDGSERQPNGRTLGEIIEEHADGARRWQADRKEYGQPGCVPRESGLPAVVVIDPDD